MRLVRDYPWHALERLTRADVRAARRARAALGGRSAQEIAAVLSELVGSNVEVLVRHWGRAKALPGARQIGCRLVGTETYCAVALEPDGVQALLGRVLGRPLGLPRQELELGSALSGALAALLTEAVRRVAGAPVELTVPPARDALELELTVLLDQQPYAAAFRAWPAELPVEGQQAPDLAGLSVRVPLVVGLAFTTRSDLERLGVGDAWCPGEGLWLDRRGAGKGILCTAASERGVWVEVTPEGEVVLRGGQAEVVADAAPDEAATAMAGEEHKPDEALAEIVAEAPVVVRLELGAVTLSAGEVGSLKPGDVLETGKRLAEPVVLRVGGRVIARGDLVEIEGELGVRIREISRRDS